MKSSKKIKMNKAMGFTALLMMFSICLLTGCSDEKQGCTDPLALNYNPDAEEDNGSCVLAGKGGHTTLIAFPQHHGEPIVSSQAYHDSLFIKFNSLEFPGDNPALYDLVIRGKIDDDHIRVKGLSQGNYFIFMTGYDEHAGERVTGGIPYTLQKKKGQVDLIVPVTE